MAYAYAGSYVPTSLYQVLHLFGAGGAFSYFSYIDLQPCSAAFRLFPGAAYAAWQQ